MSKGKLKPVQKIKENDDDDQASVADTLSEMLDPSRKIKPSKMARFNASIKSMIGENQSDKYEKFDAVRERLTAAAALQQLMKTDENENKFGMNNVEEELTSSWVSRSHDDADEDDNDQEDEEEDEEKDSVLATESDKKKDYRCNPLTHMQLLFARDRVLKLKDDQPLPPEYLSALKLQQLTRSNESEWKKFREEKDLHCRFPREEDLHSYHGHTLADVWNFVEQGLQYGTPFTRWSNLSSTPCYLHFLMDMYWSRLFRSKYLKCEQRPKYSTCTRWCDKHKFPLTKQLNLQWSTLRGQGGAQYHLLVVEDRLPLFKNGCKDDPTLHRLLLLPLWNLVHEYMGHIPTYDIRYLMTPETKSKVMKDLFPDNDPKEKHLWTQRLKIEKTSSTTSRINKLLTHESKADSKETNVDYWSRNLETIVLFSTHDKINPKIKDANERLMKRSRSVQIQQLDEDDPGQPVRNDLEPVVLDSFDQDILYQMMWFPSQPLSDLWVGPLYLPESLPDSCIVTVTKHKMNGSTHFHDVMVMAVITEQESKQPKGILDLVTQAQKHPSDIMFLRLIEYELQRRKLSILTKLPDPSLLGGDEYKLTQEHVDYFSTYYPDHELILEMTHTGGDELNYLHSVLMDCAIQQLKSTAFGTKQWVIEQFTKQGLELPTEEHTYDYEDPDGTPYGGYPILLFEKHRLMLTSLNRLSKPEFIHLTWDILYGELYRLVQQQVNSSTLHQSIYQLQSRGFGFCVFGF